MTLTMRWSTLRPDTTVRPCPACGTEPDDPRVWIRHDQGARGDHGPVWIDCPGCGKRYAATAWRRDEITGAGRPPDGPWPF